MVLAGLRSPSVFTARESNSDHNDQCGPHPWPPSRAWLTGTFPSMGVQEQLIHNRVGVQITHLQSHLYRITSPPQVVTASVALSPSVTGHRGLHDP